MSTLSLLGNVAQLSILASFPIPHATSRCLPPRPGCLVNHSLRSGQTSSYYFNYYYY